MKNFTLEDAVKRGIDEKLVKILLAELFDLRDTAACAESYLNLTRCLGGRIVVKEFICPHCDEDHTMRDCAFKGKKE